MRIYVSGPLTTDTDERTHENIRKAMVAGRVLMDRGHDIMIPHLTHFMDEWAEHIGQPIAYERWIEMDLRWVEVCDAILYLGSSPGAIREIHHAKALGKLIYYNVKQVPDISKPMEVKDDRTRD